MSSNSIGKLKQRLDLVGQKFSRLTVISFHGLDKRRNSRWLCRCECGAEKVACGGNLKRGNVQSCGCLLRQKDPNALHLNPEFKMWMSMRRRCTDHKAPNFPIYGGRGISVCDRWMASFTDFLSDMGARPSSVHQIDRIDVNGNYEPGNCRWVTAKEQGRNRRNNHVVEAFGHRRTISEWAEITGISKVTLRSRLTKYGWSAERAVSTPPA